MGSLIPCLFLRSALYTYQAMPSKEYPQPDARGAGVEVLPALIASEVEEIQLSVA